MTAKQSAKFLEKMKLKSVAVMREVMMAIEFAEQADEAVQAGAFQPHTDSELTSAESAIIAARLSLDEMSQLIEDLGAERQVAA